MTEPGAFWRPVEAHKRTFQMQALGIGISTRVGIGGDPVNGSSFLDIMQLFNDDPVTDLVVMVGDIGGPQEAEAAEHIRDGMTRPVVA